jgi:hypothetical protein
MTLNVSAYPLCAAKLKFQRADLNDPLMTPYWAAVCVAFDIRDADLAEKGGFNFNSRTDINGKALLSGLEAILRDRSHRTVANAGFAHSGLVALLGSRGVKTSALKSEDDYWTAAETLFPGQITRNGGMTALYVQINAIPKNARKRFVLENLRKLPSEWLSSSSAHARKLQ